MVSGIFKSDLTRSFKFLKRCLKVWNEKITSTKSFGFSCCILLVPTFPTPHCTFPFVFVLFSGGQTKVNCLTLNCGKRWTPGKGVGKTEFAEVASLQQVSLNYDF